MMKSVTIGDDALALALSIPAEGMPEILAFGAAVEGAASVAERARRVNGMDVAGPNAPLLPTGGLGYFGLPAIQGHRDGRDGVLDFADWQVEQDGARCRLSARDGRAGLAIAIELAIANGALSSAVTLTNLAEGVFTLDRCAAGSMMFPEGEATLTSFVGMWGREFQMTREPMSARLWLQESRRGRTSHDRSPSLILSSREGSLAAHLGWSGNHWIAVDTLDDGRRLVHVGELFEPGEIRLAQGDSYESPKGYFAPTANALRDNLRTLLTWPEGNMKPRPVTLNTWEGNYFDHKLPSLIAQAEAAAALGIERFVLDDGWFGMRDDETAALGDWFVDKRKYPDGLKPLADRVHALGMEFGLWFEPEMVNPNSDLYRAHPDWALQLRGGRAPLSRSQLVLDLTRKEVADAIFEAMHKVMSETPIDCIKWDMNRDLAPPVGADGRAVTARQTRAVYALMDRIRTAHPNVEIESCASGGGRVDYGVLTRTHRFWASDCTDALERLEIQRGARLFFPPELIGAHISASPNHQTHRRLSLDFRVLVAMAYHLGVEMDPRTLSDAERASLGDWIALHKRLRPLLHSAHGQFHLEPHDGRYVWGAACADTIVAIVAQGPQMILEQPAPLRLPTDLIGDGRWRIALCAPVAPDFVRVSDGQRLLLSGARTFDSSVLKVVGLPLPMLRPESGFMLEIHRVKGA